MVNNQNKSIGVFDSGLGGLTVVKELIKILPHENIVYFGDTGRVPYGSRSSATILKYGMQDVNFLSKQNVKMVIAACGTVSSIFIDNNINNFYFKKFFYTGVIEPTAEGAVKTTKNGKIGIIGTQATIKSKSYEKYIKNISNEIEIFSVACPLFVSIVENGITDYRENIVKDIVDYYLNDLIARDIDTLILGCTHYPMLSDAIREYMGKSVALINPGIEVAKFVNEYLIREEIINKSNQEGIKKFFVSDDIENFEKVVSQYLDSNLYNNVNIMYIN